MAENDWVEVKKAQIALRRDAEAMRFNTNKRKWSLVDFKSIEPMVEVLEFGAKKYTPDNWKKGFPKEELLESIQRHVAALIDGEENDSDSGLPHIAHIQCNCMFYNYLHRNSKFTIKS